MTLLALLHRWGVNTALVAGMLMMPAVVAVGYWADDLGDRSNGGLVLHGTISDLSLGAPDLRRTLPD